MPFKTILFDLDGTLVDTVEDVHFCINQARAEMGLPPLPLEKARESIGPGPNKFVEIVLPPDRQREIDAFIQKFRRCYIDHLSDHSRPFPGIIDLLTELQKRGFVLAVATNKPRRYTEKLLQVLGLAGYFPHIFTPDEVASRKPDPDIILKALQVTETSSGEALLVGDTDNDILAGKAAGVQTCGVTYGYGSKEIFQQLKPDFLIDRPEELLPLVGLPLIRAEREQAEIR